MESLTTSDYWKIVLELSLSLNQLPKIEENIEEVELQVKDLINRVDTLLEELNAEN